MHAHVLNRFQEKIGLNIANSTEIYVDMLIGDIALLYSQFQTKVFFILQAPEFSKWPPICF